MKHLKIKTLAILAMTTFFTSCIEEENNNPTNPLELVGT